MAFQSQFVRSKILPQTSATLLLAQLGITITGNVYWVNSTSGSDSNGGTTPSTATATIDKAVSLCTASNGDVVVCVPGHAETINATALCRISTAGVRVIGLGQGADRATITFSTSTAANIPMSAASCSLENVALLCNIDQVVAGVTISAADCALIDVEFRDTATNKEFVLPLLTTAAADRLTLRRVYHNGQTGGSHCTEAFSLIGVDSAVIEDCVTTGLYSTAAINMVTTACTRVVVRRHTFQNGTDKTLAKLMKDTQGSSTWSLANSFDLSAGRMVYGSSGQVVQPDDGNWRFASATSTSPLTAATLWTYTGSIECNIIGRVTTIIQAQGTTVKLQVTPDALAAADLCTTKDVNAFAVGSLLTVPGAVASAMIGTTAVGNAAAQTTPSVMTCVTNGTIQPVFGAASTGAIAWEMRWRPLSRGASVV